MSDSLAAITVFAVPTISAKALTQLTPTLSSTKGYEIVLRNGCMRAG